MNKILLNISNNLDFKCDKKPKGLHYINKNSDIGKKIGYVQEIYCALIFENNNFIPIISLNRKRTGFDGLFFSSDNRLLIYESKYAEMQNFIPTPALKTITSPSVDRVSEVETAQTSLNNIRSTGETNVYSMLEGASNIIKKTSDENLEISINKLEKLAELLSKYTDLIANTDSQNFKKKYRETYSTKMLKCFSNKDFILAIGTKKEDPEDKIPLDICGAILLKYSKGYNGE